MKNKIQYFFTLGLVALISWNAFAQATVTSSGKASTGNSNIVYVPFDFTNAAEKAKKASVYIEVKTDVAGIQGK
jgi:hypothetical protein